MNTGGPIPLPGGVELLNFLRVLHQNVVEFERLGGGVLHVIHRFNVIGTHCEDDTGEFARGFVLFIVLGVELSLAQTMNVCRKSDMYLLV